MSAGWWAHALGWGSVTAAGCALLLIAVLFAAPYAFLHDSPSDIRARAATPSAAQRRVGAAGSLVFLLSLLGGIAGVVWSWGAAQPGSAVLDLALMALLVGVLFAVLDLLFVDWLVICTLRPRAILMMLVISAVIGLVVAWLT